MPNVEISKCRYIEISCIEISLYQNINLRQDGIAYIPLGRTA